MNDQFITDVTQAMLPYLDNAQLARLQKTLEHALWGKEVTQASQTDNENDRKSNKKLVEMFLAAKKVEGCSDKTIRYYSSTINRMLSGIDKHVTHITTDDLRSYLSDYQEKNSCSKSNIDNIRRILSSLFSWLEDEDYILKRLCDTPWWIRQM